MAKNEIWQSDWSEGPEAVEQPAWGNEAGWLSKFS